jgi:hypothetical protein
MCVGVPALAFNPLKGPPARTYRAGGSGNALKAQFIVQLPYTFHGHRNPAFDDGVTLHDCHGSHQFVTGGSGGEIGFPQGKFSDSGRGAVINGQGTFLHRHEHFTASGTINGKKGSITYKIAGCKKRHYALRAKG